MADKPTCSTCRAWGEGKDTPGRGICRRYPPATHALVVTSDDGMDAIQAFTAWPDTGAEDWCLGHTAVSPSHDAERPDHATLAKTIYSELRSKPQPPLLLIETHNDYPFRWMRWLFG